MLRQVLNKYHILIAFLFFCILTFIWTYPVIFKLNLAVPLWGSDVYNALGQSGKEFLVLKNLGIREGLINLAKNYQINIFTPCAILNLFFSNITSYNIIFLESFILSGLGMYLLAFYFTKNKTASFIAGIIFAFAPFHFRQAMGVNLGTMHQEWLPFFILFLFKFFEKFKMKYFFILVFFGILIALTEHQLLAFTSIFVLFFFVYKIFENRELLKNKSFWIFLASTAIILLAIAYFLFAPLIKIASSNENYLNSGMGQAMTFSAKFLDPFIPPSFNSFMGSNINSRLQSLIFGSVYGQTSYFIGYSVLFLFIYLLIFLYKNRNNKKIINLKKSSYFWLASTLLFYLCSLGPAFKLAGKNIFLPYYLIYRFFPFFENIRTTGRFFVYVMISVSILATFGLKVIFEKYPKRRNFFTGFFILIIFFEFSPIPLPMEVITFSPFYEKLGMEKDFFNIIEIPGSTSQDFVNFESITANVHRKGILSGMSITRNIPGQFSMQRTTPVISQLLYPLPVGKKIEDLNKPDIYPNSQNGTAILNYYNIHYVIIDKRFLKSAEKLSTISEYMQENLEIKNVYEDNFIKAFEIKSAIPSGFFAIPVDGWGDRELEATTKALYRTIKGQSTLKIINMSAKESILSVNFSVKSEDEAPLDLYLNNQPVLNVKTNADWKKESFSLNAPIGESILKFVSENNSSGTEISNIAFTEK